MSKIIKGIIRFFDKKIILPIARFFVFVSGKFKLNSKTFEKAITKKNGLIIISLIVSIGAFYLAESRTTSLLETSAEVLYDQPISAVYNDAEYFVEGLPKTVDITLIGRKSDIYLAKQLPTNDISVDLTGLDAGVHKVNLKYKKALSSIEYKLDPSQVTIVIYKKLTEKKEINYEVINKNSIDSKLLISDVSLSNEEVYVKSNAATLNKVSSIKALVDLSSLQSNVDVNTMIGEKEIKNVKLVAYDNKGNKVKNVEIVPSKVTATVKIESPQKVVPIKVIPKNYNKIFNKAISSIVTDISNVTIYGDSSKIEKITYVPLEVDVSNLKDNKKYFLTLNKPAGVRSMSTNSVNVSIVMGEETNKEINDVYLEYENLGEGYIVQAVDADSTKVTVSVKGVSDVLKDLDPTTIKAYVDLKNYGVGEYEIPVYVTGSDLRVKYESKTTKVKLKISEKK